MMNIFAARLRFYTEKGQKGQTSSIRQAIIQIDSTDKRSLSISTLLTL
jgi:hypothetical protein